MSVQFEPNEGDHGEKGLLLTINVNGQFIMEASEVQTL